MRAAVLAERSFIERLVHFWSNHFAVSVDKLAVLGVAGAFEREAIRPHVLGSFHDLLMAVEQHPAMLLYLDNYQSVGPNSAAREVPIAAGGTPGSRRSASMRIWRGKSSSCTPGRGRGIFASRCDRICQGDHRLVHRRWRRAPARAASPAQFYFRDGLHEPGARTLLGKRYDEAGMAQGVAVLRDLAQAQATARHVSTKLARHFIADDPPSAAIDRLSKVFLSTDGDLPSVYRALIDLPEAWAQPLSKFKTPSDYIYSSYRALELPLADGPKATRAL